MSRRRGDSMPNDDPQSLGPSNFPPTSSTFSYSHVSIYRSSQIQLQLYSPCIMIDQGRNDVKGPLAVFNSHDQVGGKVILDRSCYHTGKVTVSIEGIFSYTSTSSTDTEDDVVPESSQVPKRRRHVFFSSSTLIHVTPADTSSRSAFRDAFMRRRPSATSLGLNTPVTDRHYSFAFDLPLSCRQGEELPASFVGSQDSGALSRTVDVSYKVKAIWEARDALDAPAVLDVPIVFYPDREQLPDSISKSWLEMPLISDRPMPFRCAVTLPTSVTFSRPSSIPYFVVFTTTPRSPSLAKEIAADATISVSLLRQVNFTEQISSLPTPPHTPSNSGEESDAQRSKLLKLVARSGQSRIIRAVKLLDETPDKPLPPLPNQTFTETTTLQTSICIGFPKRPRNQLHDLRGHPTLESYAALPDGLHRDEIPVPRDMLPCLDWVGLSVKYYLEVSVLVGQDNFRARIPVRIL